MRPLLFSILFLSIATQAFAAPHILVTLQPVHALISGVTEGVTEPELLLPKNISPHTYALKGEDAKKLREADIVFLVSRRLESFLTHPLQANHKTKVTVVELAKAEGIKLLPLREKSLWGEAAEDEKLATPIPDRPNKGYDPYIWLDPGNAIAIVNAAAQVLAKQDPVHAKRYSDNASKMREEINQMDAELKAKLAPYSDVPYLVTKDNYQYFEQHYRLDSLGAVAIHPTAEPSIRTLNKLQETITRYNIVCLFTDPQLSPEVMEKITEMTTVGMGRLDGLWGGENPGKETYFTLMRQLSQGLLGCFDTKRSLMS